MTNELQPGTFAGITALFHRVSGIRLTDTKQALVFGRMQKLALDHGAGNDVEAFAQKFIQGQVSDRLMVDLMDRLTTNETYFFREPQHFDDLRLRAEAAKSASEFLVWSGASSSGEEAYSIAMLLADRLGFKHPWVIHGTDLSTAMVDAARLGLYHMERARNVPPEYLKRYCLKGQGPYGGQLLMTRELRARTRFETANLMQPLPPSLPKFDVIFLRNVLIYFDGPAKAAIVSRVLERLKPGGVLYTGHAESLMGLQLPVRSVASAVYHHA